MGCGTEFPIKTGTLYMNLNIALENVNEWKPLENNSWLQVYRSMRTREGSGYDL